MIMAPVVMIANTHLIVPIAPMIPHTAAVEVIVTVVLVAITPVVMVAPVQMDMVAVEVMETMVDTQVKTVWDNWVLV